jgi:proteasome beta subunit
MEPNKTGTTTVGLVYKDGVILAADRRVSAGNMVAHKMDKIAPLSDRLGITIAGMVGDAQALVRVMRSEISLHEIRSGTKMNTREAVGLLGTILFNGRMSLNLFYTELIAGGFDTKPELYILDEVGSQIGDEYTVTGSGGVFALGVLQADYKPEMTEEDAIKLAHKAVSSSLQRDIYTGNGINIVVINKKGYKKLSDEEIANALSE